MSLFDDERYTWRETYFVLFDPAKRPHLSEVRRELLLHAGTLRILESQAEPDGTLYSITIASYEDHAALEIVYREGNDVHNEIGLLAETLERGCTAQEREKLKEAKQCRAKLEVLHFEQTAGTEEFKIVKMPELKFKKQSAFSNRSSSDKLTSHQRDRFRFDPNSYKNCVNDGAGAELDWNDSGGMEDSAVYERIDPNTLILVLEILSRLSHGVAIDPASGIVI